MSAQTLLFILAVIIIGVRLPSFMTRMGMSKRDKILFVLMVFALLAIVWGGMYVITRLI